MPHIVKYIESERGWGGEIWYIGFETKEKAEKEVFDTNKVLPNEVPDCYIMASYEGEKRKIPEGFKF